MARPRFVRRHVRASAARRRIARGAVLGSLLVTGVLVGPIGSTQGAVGSAAPRVVTSPQVAASSDPGHLFSWPKWYPLRGQGAKSSCVKTNCEREGEHYHGVWAIDWNVPKTDGNGNPVVVPVYAAGHGIAHIGGRQVDCATDTGSTKGRGNWLWIDHGGGIVSVYYHLDKFAAGIDGAAVTPITRIGDAGSSGSPCRVAKYLHFEVKSGGHRGTSLYMGDLGTCVGDTTYNRLIQLPGYLRDAGGNPVKNWDALPYQPNTPMPTANRACIPTGVPATFDAPVAPSVAYSGGITTVRWQTPPAGNLATTVGLEKWSATLNGYRPMEYHSASASATSMTFANLDLGGRYRFSIAHRNAVGFSNWSPARAIVPADVPSAPASITAWSGYSWIIFDWVRPVNTNGATVTGYEVSRRVQLRDGTWTDWASMPITTDTRMRWDPVNTLRPWRLRVRALSTSGPSPWSVGRTITVLR